MNTRPARRQFDRRKLEARLSVTTADGTIYRGWCNDLSEGGLSATLPAALAAQTEVGLQLTIPGSAEPLQLRGIVRYAFGFRYGFEFLTMTAAQRELISNFVAGQPEK